MGRETRMPSRLISFPEDNQGFFTKLFECLPHKEEQRALLALFIYLFFGGGWGSCLFLFVLPWPLFWFGGRERGKLARRGGGGQEEKRLRFFLFSSLGLFPGPFDWPNSTFLWNSTWSLHEQKQSRTQRKRQQCRLNKGQRERFHW